MATTNDIKNGSVLNIDGQLWNVVEFQHVKPGKGGAFVRTKIKSITSGKVVDRTFNAGTKIDFATVDRRDFTYLYRDGDGFVFMDTTDYEQTTVPGEGRRRRLELHAREPDGDDRDARRRPALRRAARPRSFSRSPTPSRACRATARARGTKPATLETGYEIQVPLFLEQGTKVKVDTRDGNYLGRVTD